MQMAGQDTSSLAIAKQPPKRRSRSASSKSSSSRSSSSSSSRSPSADKLLRKNDSVQNKRNYRGRHSSSPEIQRRAQRPADRFGDRNREREHIPQRDREREHIPQRDREREHIPQRDREREYIPERERQRLPDRGRDKPIAMKG